jgi:hypothetical protein
MNLARCLWLTPVILATQETEMRRITGFEAKPGQIVPRDPILKNLSQKKG